MQEAIQFDLASKTVMQILTLASAILAVSVTFASDHIAKGPRHGSIAIKLTWSLLLISIAFGSLALMAITGQSSQAKPDIWAWNIRLFGIAQILSFAVSLGSMVWAAWASLNKNNTEYPLQAKKEHKSTSES